MSGDPSAYEYWQYHPAKIPLPEPVGRPYERGKTYPVDYVDRRELEELRRRVAELESRLTRDRRHIGAYGDGVDQRSR